MRRLHDNTKVLIQTYRAIVRATHTGQSITPAAEWLLDNFHVVDEQIREIKDDLPPGFYRRLPKLADGPLEGYPRVFGIAWALVAHTDSAFDIQKLTRFTLAYQRVQPLQIGELWALAITLRILLVENLRRLAEAIVARLSAGQMADSLADRILGTDYIDPEPVALILEILDQAPWTTAFAVQLAQRLRDRDPNATPALRWLNERLAAEGTTTDQIVSEEVQRQGAMNVTVRNVITSMRLVSMINWPEFFETVSPVDAVMRGGSEFAAMDFPTRDLYRRAIEEIAHGSGKDEVEVAERAIAAAQRARSKGANARESDPGYVLLSHGRQGFEKKLGYQVPVRVRLFRLSSWLGVASYIGVIAFFTALLLAVALAWISDIGVAGWHLWLLALVGLIPASDVGVALANRIITEQVGASLLPGLELRDGVSPELATMIVVPSLLTSPMAIARQIERLEVHYLSNPDDNLYFALLSDWKDSEQEHVPEDDALLDVAKTAIARLNERHTPPGHNPRFLLLHRRRLWNEGERKWMGWERKRGKLNELNRLLRGANDTSYISLDGVAPSLPAGIQYVITLDADTRLPIGTARRLVGKIAHPLNRPIFDSHAGLVAHGHAILQPRVTPSLPIGSEGSLFQRVFSGPNGLDPYAFAVSDVYQDLFEEGSYCGKGIYDVDVFEKALDGKIPENAVLSHDLLEGIFARAGLASDIEVVEEFPSRYDVAAARQHRWVRGDWQLLTWIFGRGIKAAHGGRKTSIPLMGRWKLLDNLRRSLTAPAALLSMLLAWQLLPMAPAEIWTGYILLTMVFPSLLPALTAIVPRRGGISLGNHFRAVRSDFALSLLQAAFLITFLAHQAWLMVDAVARTLFRLFIHRRRLLEWTTAAQVSDDLVFDQRKLLTQISASVAFGAFMAVLMYYKEQQTWLLAAPFAALWVLSPFVARAASRPPPNDGLLSVTPADALGLRLIARRTWRFFETFVTAESNMLPPDNFQETPNPVVAQRTSPTNLGLYLLSAVAAHDFGWLGMLDTLERLEATMATMDRMERFRGHFFNWYDTRDLRALEPKYISSVDSGNLAGHLIALANACREFCAKPLLNPNWISGLRDNFELIRDATRSSGNARRAKNAESKKLNAALDDFEGAIQAVPENPAGLLSELASKAEIIMALAQTEGGAESETLVWATALRTSIISYLRDIDFLMPWVHAAPVSGAMPSLLTLAAYCETALAALTQRGEQTGVSQALAKSIGAAQLISHRLTTLADNATATFYAMEFGFLFDPDRQLLSIGYRAADGSLDSNYYDLLASEARLASFIAIAKGDLPAKHWFRMGRTLTPIEGGSGLISWSGSMFEYLMPSLVMRAPTGSLLEQTNRLIVRRQEEYGDSLGVPWGMSESAYNARDIEQTYQYSSFGVPDLGYKRGLRDNIVIAPYASGLAAMIAPAAAVRNYRRMAEVGARGPYGWYEALDYTRARLPEGTKLAVVRAYMAHHQAMTIIGIANTVHDALTRERFHAEPIIQAAELLLQ